jgi:hypothetical protein
MSDPQTRYIATVLPIGRTPVHVVFDRDDKQALVRCAGPADARQVADELNAYAKERTR